MSLWGPHKWSRQNIREMATFTSIRDCSMVIIDQLTIESLSAGLLSPSHLQSTQWCEVDGWCDGERKWTTPVRKMQGRFSMHLWPQKIRKVTEERIGKSFSQRFSETKLLQQTEQWQSWWSTVKIIKPSRRWLKTSALKVKLRYFSNYSFSQASVRTGAWLFYIILI